MIDAFLQYVPTLTPQAVVLSVLALAFLGFIWGKWRYDLVAVVALLLVIFGGVVSGEQAFLGFIHPAVIIITSMFVIGKGLTDSGIFELLLRKVTNQYLERRPVLQLAVLVVMVTFISAFINNIGALAFMMPIAIKLARQSNVSPAMYLIPLAFGSHLGGFLTLIGSSRNIIVSAFRETAVGTPFTMFQFSYAGIGIVLVGIIFLAFVSWRLLPGRRNGGDAEEEFAIQDYVTEVRIAPESPISGQTIGHLQDSVDSRVKVVALIRDEINTPHPARQKRLQEDDILLIQDDPEALTELIEVNGLTLTGNKSAEAGASPTDEVKDAELAVSPHSTLAGKTWQEIPLRQRFGINLLALAREGGQLSQHLTDTRFRPGDVLLVRGREETIEEVSANMEALPLAERELQIGRTPKVWATLAIFIITVALASFPAVPIHLVFLTAAVAMVALRIVGLEEAYKSINWSIVILLGAMITIGLALQSSGAAQDIANILLQAQDMISPVGMLAAVLIITTLLSDFVNSNAAAIIMAPIAFVLAQSIGASIDPFLMAVAIASNIAFLTPYGHESNALVMKAGDYKFKDYLTIGLPLEILILAVTIPLLLFFWPLF